LKAATWLAIEALAFTIDRLPEEPFPLMVEGRILA
jgi:hypothetical protein